MLSLYRLHRCWQLLASSKFLKCGAPADAALDFVKDRCPKQPDETVEHAGAQISANMQFFFCLRMCLSAPGHSNLAHLAQRRLLSLPAVRRVAQDPGNVELLRKLFGDELFRLAGAAALGLMFLHRLARRVCLWLAVTPSVSCSRHDSTIGTELSLCVWVIRQGRPGVAACIRLDAPRVSAGRKCSVAAAGCTRGRARRCSAIAAADSPTSGAAALPASREPLCGAQRRIFRGRRHVWRPRRRRHLE